MNSWYARSFISQKTACQKVATSLLRRKHHYYRIGKRIISIDDGIVTWIYGFLF
jgi:glutamine phosphoribosylpyrophosphate amidotransferase